MTDEPREDKISVTCKSCGKSTDILAPQDVTTGQWRATIEAQTCQMCGALYRFAAS